MWSSGLGEYLGGLLCAEDVVMGVLLLRGECAAGAYEDAQLVCCSMDGVLGVMGFGKDDAIIGPR